MDSLQIIQKMVVSFKFLRLVTPLAVKLAEIFYYFYTTSVSIWLSRQPYNYLLPAGPSLLVQ